jgi:hypothetical protein
MGMDVPPQLLLSFADEVQTAPGTFILGASLNPSRSSNLNPSTGRIPAYTTNLTMVILLSSRT